MKTFKLILKGILFYTTVVAFLLFICSVDSLYNEGYFFRATFIVAILGFACELSISEEEVNILTGNMLP